MNPLLDPVGPLDRGVYWRRRGVLLAVLVVVLLLLARACGGEGPSGAPAKAPASGPASSAAAAPTTATSSPSKSASPVRACTDADIVVTARPAKSNYAVGDTVNVTFVVATKGDVRCKRDVGAAANEVRVTSAGSLIWSSDVCSPGGTKDVRTIGPDDSYSVIVEWDGTVAAASCPDERLPAPAGEYQVLGRNGQVVGKPAPLTLG